MSEPGTSFCENPGTDWYNIWEYLKTSGRFTTNIPGEYHSDLIVLVSSHVLKRHLVIINDQTHFERICFINGNRIQANNVTNPTPLLLGRLHSAAHYQSLVYTGKQSAEYWTKYCQTVLASLVPFQDQSSQASKKGNKIGSNKSQCRGCKKMYVGILKHIKKSLNCSIKYSSVEIEDMNIKDDQIQIQKEALKQPKNHNLDKKKLEGKTILMERSQEDTTDSLQDQIKKYSNQEDSKHNYICKGCGNPFARILAHLSSINARKCNAYYESEEKDEIKQKQDRIRQKEKKRRKKLEDPLKFQQKRKEQKARSRDKKMTEGSEMFHTAMREEQSRIWLAGIRFARSPPWPAASQLPATQYQAGSSGAGSARSIGSGCALHAG